MFFNSHFGRVRQIFADQFSRDPGGLIYRRSQRGAPIRVSEMERDQFIATFDRRTRYATWSIFPATVGLILLLAWLIPDFDSPSAPIAVWIGIAAILVPVMAIYWWAWNAPSGALKCRSPVGMALTKEEARALAFSQITYGNFALAALIGAGMIWKMASRSDVFDVGGVILLIVGGGLIGMAAVQALRKWRFSQK